MTTLEIQKAFPKDLDAIMYFEHLRWGDAVRCAYCNTIKVSKRQSDKRFHCSQCRKTFSITTGTYLHSSKLPLRIWMQALSMLSDNDNRLSIKQLQHGLQISYTTAWRIRHEIKSIMENFKVEKDNVFESLCRKAISEQSALIPQPTV
jgi:transposase-like protein